MNRLAIRLELKALFLLLFKIVNYLALRIIKREITYDVVVSQYGKFKKDIDKIIKDKGYNHLIIQQ